MILALHGGWTWGNFCVYFGAAVDFYRAGTRNPQQEEQGLAVSRLWRTLVLGAFTCCVSLNPHTTWWDGYCHFAEDEIEGLRVLAVNKWLSWNLNLDYLIRKQVTHHPELRIIHPSPCPGIYHDKWQENHGFHLFFMIPNFIMGIWPHICIYSCIGRALFSWLAKKMTAGDVQSQLK